MKTLRRIFKILVYAAALFLIVIFILGAITQTAFFKDRVRVLLVSSLSDRLNGSIRIGTLGGNFFTGITVDSVEIYAETGLFLRAERVLVKYDLMTLFDKSATMRYLIVDRPTIYLLRSRAGEWNYAKLLKPSGDTTHGTFDWNVFLNDLELKNGMLTVFDSTFAVPPGGDTLAGRHFTEGRFSFKDINVQLKASVRPEDFDVHLLHTSFYSDRPVFELIHCAGDFRVSAGGVSATNVILHSGRSQIGLDGRVPGLDLFRKVKAAALQHDSAQIKLNAKNIDFSELKEFIPELSFLEGSASIDLAADGEFGNLTIRRLKLDVQENSINVAGTVRNLQRADRLDLDLFLGSSYFDPSVAAKLMPGMQIPTFERGGPASVNVRFIGRPLDFRTRTIVRGKFGECDVAGSINLEKKIPRYELSFTTKRLDLASILSNQRINSALFTTGKLDGEGISAGQIRATLSVRIDSSRFRNLPIDAAQLTLQGSPHRFEGSVEATSQKMKAVVSGLTDLTIRESPKFSGDISFQGINLARVLDDPRYGSDLTLEGTVSGSGRTIDDINTDIKFLLMPSTFQGHSISAQEIRFFLDQHDPASKRLSLHSSVMDLDLNGTFDLDLAGAALIHQTSNLLETIREHAMPPESLKARKAAPGIGPHVAPQRRMDFDYTLHVKDLDPVATLIEGQRFDGRAILSGAIHGTEERLSFSCNGAIDECFIGTFEKGVLLNRATLTVALDSLGGNSALENLTARGRLRSESGLVNTTRIDSLDIDLDYRQLKGTLSIKGVVDSVYSIIMAGQTSVQPHTYAFDVDNLTFTSGAYRWHNDQDVQVRVNYDGTRVMHAVMLRNAEQFSLTGVLHHDGEFDFDAALNKFDLTGLAVFVRNPELLRPDQGFRGLASATLHLAGSPENPFMTFKAVSDSAYFRQTRIGSVEANILYGSATATIGLTVKKMPSDPQPTLVVKGTLPINLAFSGVQERFPPEKQHLEIVSQGFDLSVFDPILRDFENLRGQLHCEITVAGTPRDPEYLGSITLSDVSFTFADNNVPYSISADLEPSGNKIVLKSFQVRNLQKLGPVGEARVSGSLIIKNYQIDSIDFTAFGQILLMSEATRKTRSTVYGSLFTEIGSEGLSLRGPIAHPYLTGNLYVRDANLTFPPVRETAGSSSQMALNYVVLDDTSKAAPQTARPSKFYSGNDARHSSSRTAEVRDRGSLFLDRLRYNLSIETRGTTAIKMIFTPSTNEELYAELDGRVSVVNSQGYPSVTGEIAVLPHSYYNFFRRFDASGKLKFVGQWDNPELEIEATYESYRTDPAHDSLQQKVIVQLNIGGSRYEPKLDMSMKVQLQPDQEPVDWASQARGGDVQSDAISFILTGKFRDELTSKERGDIASSVGSTAGSGLTSGLLSGVLTDFLRQEFPFIRSAEVSYAGGSFQQGANVRLSGEAFKGYWQVGGKILNDIGNANVSYQMSLGDVLKAPSIHNLFLEIQRRVEGDISEEKKLTNEARLYYRFSF
ncbi:MAG: hypothetical protein AUI33_02690 [Ignavibacteria bacterium 13_1_40CM_2_61_4]|nr:MAG: hypothetical protein AUI33_02690 [Ignavibacteria bacterium 13_1_40CM_2_61_4]